MLFFGAATKMLLSAPRPGLDRCGDGFDTVSYDQSFPAVTLI
jgi:hypothetical protein